MILSLEKRKKIFLFVLWFCSLCVISGEIWRVFSAPSTHHQKLVNFYQSLYRHDDCLAEREKEVDNLSPNIKRALFYLIFIVFMIFHIRVNRLKELYKLSVKKEKEEVKEIGNNFYTFIVVILLFFFIRDVSSIFVTSFNKSGIKPERLSPQDRSNRLTYQIKKYINNKENTNKENTNKEKNNKEKNNKEKNIKIDKEEEKNIKIDKEEEKKIDNNKESINYDDNDYIPFIDFWLTHLIIFLFFAILGFLASFIFLSAKFGEKISFFIHDIKKVEGEIKSNINKSFYGEKNEKGAQITREGLFDDFQSSKEIIEENCGKGYVKILNFMFRPGIWRPLLLFLCLFLFYFFFISALIFPFELLIFLIFYLIKKDKYSFKQIFSHGSRRSIPNPRYKNTWFYIVFFILISICSLYECFRYLPKKQEIQGSIYHIFFEKNENRSKALFQIFFDKTMEDIREENKKKYTRNVVNPPDFVTPGQE